MFYTIKLTYITSYFIGLLQSNNYFLQRLAPLFTLNLKSRHFFRPYNTIPTAFFKKIVIEAV